MTGWSYDSPIKPLGKLHKVPLRDVRVHEALPFTKRLTGEANLALLGDEFELDVTLVQAERSIEEFNVDILADETNSSKKVVIGNQLEQIDRDHLGKLLTHIRSDNG